MDFGGTELKESDGVDVRTSEKRVLLADDGVKTSSRLSRLRLGVTGDVVIIVCVFDGERREMDCVLFWFCFFFQFTTRVFIAKLGKLYPYWDSASKIGRKLEW